MWGPPASIIMRRLRRPGRPLGPFTDEDVPAHTHTDSHTSSFCSFIYRHLFRKTSRPYHSLIYCVCNLTQVYFLDHFSFSFSFCHLFEILCTMMFSSKPICICIANIHFHFGFMCLPSLLIGFGSFPNVQCVPNNNYIPEEICMNFVTDFDGLSAHR